MMLSRSIHQVFIPAFLVIYLSIIFWYDLRILAARGHIAAFNIQPVFYVWAGGLLPFIFYFLTKISREQKKHPFLFVCLIYFTVSLLVGLYRGNDLVYLVGDSYKFFLMVSGFGLYAIARPAMADLFKVFCYISLFYLVGRLVFYAIIGGGLGNIYYGNVYDVIAVGFLFILLFEANRRFSLLNRYPKLTIFIVLLIVVAGQKKLVIVCLTCFYLLASKKTKFAVALIAATALSQIFASELVTYLEATRFRVLLNMELLFSSESVRLEEAQAALQLWLENFSSFVFGFGFGAELQYISSIFGPVNIHSIHNSYLATVYRSGIFGLILLLFVAYYAFSGVLQRSSRTVSALLVSILVSGIFVYTIVDELIVGFLLAHIINERQARREKSI